MTKLLLLILSSLLRSLIAEEVADALASCTEDDECSLELLQRGGIKKTLVSSYTDVAVDPSCSAAPECAKLKLAGNCCPNDAGISLGCCPGSATAVPSPAVASVPKDSKRLCQNNPACQELNLEVKLYGSSLWARLASSVSFFRVAKMLRVAARSIAARTFSVSLRPAIRPAAVAVLPSRSFAAAAASKPKMEDGTLEGRYATALFMASKDKLDKVYGDLSALRGMMAESQELKLAIETPGIEPDSKVAAFEAICSKAGMDGAVVNFLKVLVENKRAHLLSRMIDIFENFYRAEKGLVLCKVTSAAPLTSAQQGQVKAAMQQRAQGSELIMEYNTNPALLGGLVVKMGEAVLDNSVSTRLERLQSQLLAPVA